MTHQRLCYVIMPFSVPDGSDYADDHFTEVYEDLFIPAIDTAGFVPQRADTTILSRHILADLLGTIEKVAVVLCDLSGANPNVLFELGWAFRADKPCVLVKDDVTQYPFDLQHSHVQTYHGSLKARLVREEIHHIAQLVQNTSNDQERRWSLVQSLGLDARLRSEAEHDRDPIAAAILEIRDELSALRKRIESTDSPSRRRAYDVAGEEPAAHYSACHDSTRDEIIAALEDERGNVGRAARVLGISKQRLYELVHALDIPLQDIRK